MADTLIPAATLLPAEDLALVDAHTAELVTGLKRSTRHAQGRAGTFPLPLRLSSRCSRYRAGDLRRWLQDPFNWQPSLAIDTQHSQH